MNAMEKVAWTELIVSTVTLAVVALLYPWLGFGATGAFGLLGLLALGMWFLRQRGSQVVVDERDRTIERSATQLGIGAAWMGLFLTLIMLVLWSSYYNEGVVPTWMLTWLVWLQFAVCYGVKGLAAVLAYRKQAHAA